MKQFRVLVNGNEYKVAIEELEEGSDAGGVSSASSQNTVPASKPAQRRANEQAAEPETQAQASVKPPAKAQSAKENDGNIVAAMPGTILELKVAAGDSVTKGQPLLVLEAMKMENDVMAPHDGVVEEIQVAKGASVNSGDLLMVLV